MSGEEEEEIFEVEDILGEIVYEGNTLYQVRWKGYPPDKDTYEPLENLQCPEIFERYLNRCCLEQEQRKKEKKKEKEKKKNKENSRKEAKGKKKDTRNKDIEEDEFLPLPHTKKSSKKKTSTEKSQKKKKENIVVKKVIEETNSSDFDFSDISSESDIIIPQNSEMPDHVVQPVTFDDDDFPPVENISETEIISETSIISSPKESSISKSLLSLPLSSSPEIATTTTATAAATTTATASTAATTTTTKLKSKSTKKKSKSKKKNKRKNKKETNHNSESWEIGNIELQEGQIPLNPTIDCWDELKGESPISIKVKQSEINRVFGENNGEIHADQWVSGHQTALNPFPIMKMEKLINENGIMKIICQIPDENDMAIPLAFLKVIQPEMVNDFLISEYRNLKYK